MLPPNFTTTLSQFIPDNPLAALLLACLIGFFFACLFPSFRARLKRHYDEHRASALILLFVLAFLIIYLIPSSIIFIQAGKAGVLFRRFSKGVQTDVVYGEGCHFIWPFNTMTIYDVRVNQTVASFEVLTSNGLSVRVETSVRYFPKVEYLGLLHKQIGPEYVQRIVIPETQAAVRRVFGAFTPQQIYQTQYSLPFTIRNEAARQLNDRFIVLDDLLIKAIELPPTVQTAIQSKLVAEQAAEEMKFRIARELSEKERLVIEAEGIKQFNDTVKTSLTGEVLQFKSIAAFLELAKSGNSNVIVFGNPGNIPMLLPLPGQTNPMAPAGTAPVPVTSAQTSR